MRVFSLSVLTSAALLALPAMAGNFVAIGSAAPSPATVGQEMVFSFPVQYGNQDASACGVQVNFGDGAVALDGVKKSAYPLAYTIKHTYAKSSAGMPFGGRYIATLTPNAHGGMVACPGNGTTATVMVNPPLSATEALVNVPPTKLAVASATVSLAPGNINGLTFTKKTFDPKEPIAYTVQGNGLPCSFSLTFSPNLAMATAINHPGSPPPPPPPPSPAEMSFPKSGQLPFSATQNEGIGAGLIKPWSYTVIAEASASDKAKGDGCKGKAIAGITVGGSEAVKSMATTLN